MKDDPRDTYFWTVLLGLLAVLVLVCAGLSYTQESFTIPPYKNVCFGYEVPSLCIDLYTGDVDLGGRTPEAAARMFWRAIPDAFPYIRASWCAGVTLP